MCLDKRSLLPGWGVYYADELAGSNRVLLDAMGGGDTLDRSRVALWTGYQRAGEGRQGRNWYCPPGEGLLASFRMDLDVHPLLGLLSPACCLLLLESLESLLGASATGQFYWKWPNDLVALQDGQAAKLAGILIQTQIQAQCCRMVAGLGVNLKQLSFPDDLGQSAVSLAGMGHTLLAQDLLLSLLKGFDRLGDLLLEPDLVQQKLEARHLLRHFPAHFRDGDTLADVEHVRLLPDGRLQINWKGGERIFAAGELLTEMNKDCIQLAWRAFHG